MRMRSRALSAASVVALATGLSGPALADTYYWTFSAGDSPLSGQGTITTGALATKPTNEYLPGIAYTVTGITGTFDGYTILGLDTKTTFPGLQDLPAVFSDNFVYPGQDGYGLGVNGDGQNGYLDLLGIAFILAKPNTPGYAPTARIGNDEEFTIVTGYVSETEGPTTTGTAGGTFTLTAVNCFLRGTRILTARGELEIECLTAEDQVLTIRGSYQRIRRIERQVVSPSLEHFPIRLARSALSDDAPHRDLYVSPSHCLYVDGVLIPAVDLINGSSINRCGHEGDIEYFHIELDTHEVIYAERAAVESLLREGMTRFAPLKARNGGRSELEAILRRLAQPVIDIRDPIQVVYDRLSRRALCKWHLLTGI
jgi:hypothetical protein